MPPERQAKGVQGVTPCGSFFFSIDLQRSAVADARRNHCVSADSGASGSLFLFSNLSIWALSPATADRSEATPARAGCALLIS
jgi:hypothetical protein